ncbi:MAG: HAD family phosphatase [Erysipelotrichaceae bacterium]|nr:HAD family phosphatase [Erysipelotrichaceae bacterium]
MLKAIIFDMDGLMINSEEVTYERYVKVLKDMNLDMSREFYTSLLGQTVPRAFEKMRAFYGEDFPCQDVIDKVHILLNDDFKDEGIPIKKGLVELLEYLTKNNYKIIVASSSNKERVTKLLQQVDVYQYLDDCICGDEVSQGKPNPEIFLKACEKLHVLPSEAMVIEDSEAGIEAAHTAHIPVICIPDMKYPDKEYADMTYKILESLDQVIDVLESPS